MPEGSKEPPDKKGLLKLILYMFVPLIALLLFVVLSDTCSK